MIKFFALAAVLSTVPGQASANPACAVCTIAIGASLEIARNLGVEDAIVGLWAGALLTLLGYWTIVFFDKKNWHFAGRFHFCQYVRFCLSSRNRLFAQSHLAYFLPGSDAVQRAAWYDCLYSLAEILSAGKSEKRRSRSLSV